MGHTVHIQSKEQYLAALQILDTLPGTWQGVGPSSAPVLLLTDAHYNALLNAGVILAHDNGVQPHGIKANGKKTKS